MFTISYTNNLLFITFDTLIAAGEIEVADRQGKIRVHKKFTDSNFEKIKIKGLHGRISVTVHYDRQQSKKTLYILKNS